MNDETAHGDVGDLAAAVRARAAGLDEARRLAGVPRLGELVEALARAQGKFADVKRSKTAHIPGKDGKQGYEYSYADLADIVAAVRGPLSEEGIAWGQDVKTTPHAVVVTTILRKGEALLSFGPYELPSGGGPQQYGSATSYARRYGLSSALGIAAEIDDDAASVIGSGTGPQSGPKRIAQTQMARLHAVGAERGLDHEQLTDMAGRNGFESLKELTDADARAFIAELEKLPKVQEPTTESDSTSGTVAPSGDDPGASAPAPTEGGGERGSPPGDAAASPDGDRTDPAPPLSIDELRTEAKRLYGSQAKVVSAYRKEFSPEGAVSFPKIDADELRVLVALALEASPPLEG